MEGGERAAKKPRVSAARAGEDVALGGEELGAGGMADFDFDVEPPVGPLPGSGAESLWVARGCRGCGCV